VNQESTRGSAAEAIDPDNSAARLSNVPSFIILEFSSEPRAVMSVIGPRMEAVVVADAGGEPAEAGVVSRRHPVDR